jgi:hypothetical protein
MDLFEFKDSFRLDESERVVCIGERALVTRALSESELAKLFGGWIIYGDPSGRDYLGVWGARKARTLRRILRERGVDISLTRARPDAIHMTVRHCQYACRLTATLHLLSTAEGGRQTAIRKEVYRPQFSLGLSSASCCVDDIDKETLSPGEEGEVEMTLMHPQRFGTKLHPGATFEIREGSRVVGRGIVNDVRPWRCHDATGA